MKKPVHRLMKKQKSVSGAKNLSNPLASKNSFKKAKLESMSSRVWEDNANYASKHVQQTRCIGGTGKVGITEDLCVYCGACVLNCMVNDCIKVERKREDGKTECFTKPRDVIMLQERSNSQKRFERVRTNAATKRHYLNKDDKLQKYLNLKQLYVDQEYKV
jgi:NAD-dependent dihydropyrimidine dehydrogenase PreA subunit